MAKAKTTKGVKNTDIVKAAKAAGRGKGRSAAAIIADAKMPGKAAAPKKKGEKRTNRTDTKVKVGGKTLFI